MNHHITSLKLNSTHYFYETDSFFSFSLHWPGIAAIAAYVIDDCTPFAWIIDDVVDLHQPKVSSQKDESKEQEKQNNCTEKSKQKGRCDRNQCAYFGDSLKRRQSIYC